ncbi:hypothetical protein [Nocardia sp. NPDC048505]|uniref:hypothetical protein n=1 Tax=unclassified Nocardia TaxID=2637762 RepID=UPI0033FD028A
MAIVYYWALAQMMKNAGVGLTEREVEALMNQWLAGTRRAWISRSDDAATGWVLMHLWMRSEAGQPLQVTTRVLAPDITVVDVRPLTDAQVAEFEQWEARNEH